MIDLDEFERIVNCFPFDGDILVLSKGECKDLLSRLRQAEKDAARYRWLRDLPGDSAHEEIGNYPGDMWDDAIDEAMQCNK